MKGTISSVQRVHGTPFIQLNIEPEELKIKAPQPVSENDSDRVVSQYMGALTKHIPQMFPTGIQRPTTIILLTEDEYRGLDSPTVGDELEFDLRARVK